MPQHLVAYYEAQDGAGAYHNIAAVADVVVFTSGDDVRVPDEIANIIGMAQLSDATAALTSGRFSSPTLRQKANPNLEPIPNAVVFGSPPEFNHFPQLPIALKGNESVRCEINSDQTSGNSTEYGLLLLADGAQSPAPGAMFSVRGDASITLSAGTWVNGAITFEPTLPEGNYQVVGMRFRGTNLVAARLVFPGQSWRPGAPAINALGDRDLESFRFGHGGIYGQFDTNQPPTLDALGVSDTAQDIVLDLIQV